MQNDVLLIYCTRSSHTFDGTIAQVPLVSNTRSYKQHRHTSNLFRLFMSKKTDSLFLFWATSFLCSIFSLQEQKLKKLITRVGCFGKSAVFLCFGSWADQLITGGGKLVSNKNNNNNKTSYGAAAYQLGNTSSYTITEVKQR